MATKGKSKSWPKLGTVRKNQEGVSYIKLEDNVTILIDGEPVSMNKTKTVRLEDPRAKVEQLAANGHITEAEADKRLERLSELQWLRYELIVPPARD